MKKISLIIISVLIITFAFMHSSVVAKTMPTISIVSVNADETVTIRSHNFPANYEFSVLMGKMGTKGVNGIHVATISSGTGGSFDATFSIPPELKGDYQIAIRLASTSGGFYAYNWFYNATTASPPITDGTTGIPTFSITDVAMDDSVTIQTHNFPANYDFKVLMGKMGTKGIDGIHVATISSGTGGSFNATFSIPAELKGNYQIAIRLASTSGGFYAYNWFFNNTTLQPGTGGSTGGFAGIPTFSITAVVKDSTVTIQTSNFPANYDFKVLMGKMGTKGIDGILVSTINSDKGGAFTQTFDVPSALADESRIAIRLQATSGGFYAYNWFYNNTYP
ncbi:MAG: hypothetical protein GX142_04490 [Chloroflexi bacterium]|nr:hypothetical protein [Chloroflexota bacterium]